MRPVIFVIGSGATVMALASCGSILGLGDEPNAISEGPADASPDVDVDVRVDADAGAVRDVGAERDADAADVSPIDAGFALTLATSMLHVRRGSTTSLAVVSPRYGGFNAPIAISTSPLPSKVSASSVTIVPSSEQQSLTLNAATDAALGAATFSVNATAGGITRSLTVDLLVQDAPGTLDTTFGTDGISIIPFAPYASRIGGEGLALQPDGNILVCGGAETADQTVFNAEIARLNGSNGALDTGFGTQGIASLQQDDLRLCTAVKLLPGGGIMLAGFGATTHHTMAVVQLTAAGALDKGFGRNNSGAVGIVLQNAETKAYTMAVQSDGRLLLGGFSEVEGGAVIRLTSTGDLDPTFALATGGAVSFGGVGLPSVVGMRLRSDGTVVVSPSSSTFVTAHLTAAGTIDTAYGVAGYGNASTGVQIGDVGGQLAIQADDRIVVSGSLADDAGVPAPIVLARFNTDGGLDPSFGSQGIVSTTLAGGDAKPIALAIAPDGHIAAAATLPTGSFGVIRYTSAGVLDTTFAGVGYAATPTTDGVPEAIAIDRYGRILVAGTAVPLAGKTAYVVRYWP